MAPLRVAFASLAGQVLRDMQAGMRRVQDAHEVVSSGLRLRRMSDDPAAGAGVLEAAGRLRAIDQYRRNASLADSYLAAEEAALSQLGDLLTRAREIAVQQANDTSNSMTRAAAKAEVLRLIETVSDLGNTRVAGGYLFGGATPDVAPFSGNGALAAGDTPPRAVEVSPGQLLRLSHNAEDVFSDTGALAALNQLAAELDTGDSTALARAAADLDAALAALQDRIADIGGRALRLDTVTTNLDALDANLRIHRSDLEDADLEVALTDLIGRENVLQATLLSASRMLSFNLTDYLR